MAMIKLNSEILIAGAVISTLPCYSSIEFSHFNLRRPDAEVTSAGVIGYYCDYGEFLKW